MDFHDYDWNAMSEEEKWLILPNFEGRERGFLLLQLAMNQYSKDDSPQLRPLAEEALSVFRELDERRETAESLELIGYAMTKDNEHDDAIECYTEALNIWRESHTIDRAAMCAQMLGDTHATLNNYEEALSWYDEALACARDAGTYFTITIATTRAMHCMAKLGQTAEAAALGKEVIDEVRGEAAWHQMVELYSAVISANLHSGEYDEALELARKAHSIALACSCDHCSIRAKYALADCLVHCGQTEEAISRFHELATEARAMDKMLWIGIALNALAELTQSDNEVQAFEYASQAADINEMINSERELGRSRIFQLRSLVRQDKVEEVVEFTRKHFDYFESLKNDYNRLSFANIYIEYQLIIDETQNAFNADNNEAFAMDAAHNEEMHVQRIVLRAEIMRRSCRESQALELLDEVIETSGLLHSDPHTMADAFRMRSELTITSNPVQARKDLTNALALYVRAQNLARSTECADALVFKPQEELQLIAEDHQRRAPEPQTEPEISPSLQPEMQSELSDLTTE